MLALCRARLDSQPGEWFVCIQAKPRSLMEKKEFKIGNFCNIKSDLRVVNVL